METEHPYQPQPLTAASTTVDGVTVVTVTGEIDHHSAAPLTRALHPDGLGKRPRVVVDMRQVTFTDSSGINVLLTAHRDLTQADGWLRLASVQESVMRTLKIVGVDMIVPCRPSLDDALTG
ncbi:STAS domain-containing protein [Streptomyces collinus]|uniref:STAS domain-containing protein n=1 Tax=Streptomyces collinus TaxID=42684 RepID=UPI0010E487BA